MTNPDGYLDWDLAALSHALKIGEDDVLEYFTDGRRVSFLLERRIATEVLKGTLALSEGAGFDLLDRAGGKWEVRSISAQGAYFCPSYMVGSGRKFEPLGFVRKLDALQGFILSDIEAFPKVPFWIIPSALVRQWWDQGRLGVNSKISRAKALAMLSEERP